MQELESLFSRRPIQKLRVMLATLRQAGGTRLKRVKRWRRWFVRGAIVGAAWAVLYAPQSGAETRHAVSKVLRPLALTGTSLLTWLRNLRQARQDQVAEGQVPERLGNITEEWRLARRAAETSRSGGTQEEVERQMSRPSS